MKGHGERLANCIEDSGVGLVGLVDFTEFDEPIYHNYAWQIVDRMLRRTEVETWEAAFVLFGITRCVAENYADSDSDIDSSVWKAIGTKIECSKPEHQRRLPRELRQDEQSRLGQAYRDSLRRFRFPHPKHDFGIDGLKNIGPMLFHAGFAGATIKPVVRLIRRAYESLNGFDNTADPDVRRQWVSTTSSQAQGERI